MLCCTNYLHIYWRKLCSDFYHHDWPKFCSFKQYQVQFLHSTLINSKTSHQPCSKRSHRANYMALISIARHSKARIQNIMFPSIWKQNKSEMCCSIICKIYTKLITHGNVQFFPNTKTSLSMHYKPFTCSKTSSSGHPIPLEYTSFPVTESLTLLWWHRCSEAQSRQAAMSLCVEQIAFLQSIKSSPRKHLNKCSDIRHLKHLQYNNKLLLSAFSAFLAVRIGQTWIHSRTCHTEPW